MPSREADFHARMVADTALMVVLTGGVYQSGLVGLVGISRESTPSAFGADGYLKPCVLIAQGGAVPDGNVIDEEQQIDSSIQIVRLWFYQDVGYDQIDLAMARTRVLFFGEPLPNSFPLRIANVIDRSRDDGALSGASMARQDWQVNSVTGA